MLIIKAKSKQTGSVHEFTPSEWYDAQQTGQYEYLSTVYKAEQSPPTAPKQSTVKRGCGCANKNKN
jgi:hypothetical protein